MFFTVLFPCSVLGMQGGRDAHAVTSCSSHVPSRLDSLGAAEVLTSSRTLPKGIQVTMDNQDYTVVNDSSRQVPGGVFRDGMRANREIILQRSGRCSTTTVTIGGQIDYDSQGVVVGSAVNRRETTWAYNPYFKKIMVGLGFAAAGAGIASLLVWLRGSKK